MIAILSDIHANALALQAVLKDMDALGISSALCLGDTIGYGPDSRECVSLVHDHCVASVMGNHEAMLLCLELLDGAEQDALVGHPLLLAREQLDDALPWIKALPISGDFEAFEIVHASLHDPAGFHYIEDPGAAAENFLAQKRPVSFHGHTHFPAIWERSETGKVHCFTPAGTVRLDPDRQYAINPGSIGQPRDGDPRASYMAYEHSSGILMHRRVEYDVKEAGKRFRKAGIAAKNRTRLLKGE